MPASCVKGIGNQSFLHSMLSSHGVRRDTYEQSLETAWASLKILVTSRGLKLEFSPPKMTFNGVFKNWIFVTKYKLLAESWTSLLMDVVILVALSNLGNPNLYMPNLKNLLPK